MENKNKFPIKSCLITSLIIFLTYLISLGIFASIAKYAYGRYATAGMILIIVFSSVFGLLLIFYWIRMIHKYSKENGQTQ